MPGEPAEEKRVSDIDGLDASTLRILDGFESAVMFEVDGGLPPRVRNLGLTLAFTNKGSNARAHRHGRLALSQGLTRQEAVEGIMAGVVARGLGMLTDMLWLVDEAPDGGSRHEPEVELADTEAILEYMTQAFGAAPSWSILLAETSPRVLEAYYQLRATVFRDAALPRRYKELLVVILNATERFEVGLEAHMRGAIAAGASRSEVLDAAVTSIASGGIVAWLAAAGVAGRVLDDPALSGPR
jgi:alkylhydroperoxidase/carboxymuconolactone decarboxylase family protein YurZ